MTQGKVQFYNTKDLAEFIGHLITVSTAVFTVSETTDRCGEKCWEVEFSGGY